MSGIYIHIPFCRKKCIYCDFYSIGANGYEDRYVSNLIKEFELRKNELSGEAVRTIYFGGGTPSLLSATQIGEIYSAIKSLGVDDVEEFTVEVNPDDVSVVYIKSLTEIGVNRISMGVQSFVDEELKIINRRHSAEDALTAVENIKNAGIKNISIDLIYGLPGQTLESLRYSLAKAIELDVAHISCYNLSYEEGTRLYLMREKGSIKECDDDTCVAMYEEIVKTLSDNGYEHYEVSNFAKNGMYSKHNSNYWNGTIYLGLGAAAHSYDGTVRSYNIANVKQYMSAIESGHLACEREELNADERYDEYVMIRMRTKWGVKLCELLDEFGQERYDHFVREATSYIDTGKIINDNGRYYLSEDGVMLSDMIIRDLMC